ncbi:hypothetical protein KCU91_g62, partial [Aureobasidium melanogenum]
MLPLQTLVAGRLSNMFEGGRASIPPDRNKILPLPLSAQHSGISSFTHLKQTTLGFCDLPHRLLIRRALAEVHDHNAKLDHAHHTTQTL